MPLGIPKSFDRHFQCILDGDTSTVLKKKRDGGWMTWVNFFFLLISALYGLEDIDNNNNTPRLLFRQVFEAHCSHNNGKRETEQKLRTLTDVWYSLRWHNIKYLGETMHIAGALMQMQAQEPSEQFPHYLLVVFLHSCVCSLLLARVLWGLLPLTLMHF